MKPPAEYKVMPVRECVAPVNLIETPEQVFEYWQANIPKADWYDPCKEAFVVLLLNTRKRILGHNLVALGSLDSCVVTPLSVFRPALVFSATPSFWSTIYVPQHINCVESKPAEGAEPRPPVRTLQIEADGEFWKGLIKPKIRLMGRWLERAGFRPGDRVKVTCVAPGVIELRSFHASTANGVKLSSPEQSDCPL